LLRIKKTLTETNAGKDAGKKGTLILIGGDVNWYNHCGNHYECFSKS
jgi:thymidine kinase